jgi:hypothetical protein
MLGVAMATPLLILIPFVLVLAILYATLCFERWRNLRRNRRPPASDKRLRPPGGSLRRKLEDIDWKFAGAMMQVVAVGLLTSGCLGVLATLRKENFWLLLCGASRDY